MKAIKTTYHGPTNANGSRIRATDMDGNSITVPYPHEAREGADAHAVAALALCRKMGWDGTLIAGALNDCYVFTFEEGDRYPIATTDEEHEALATTRRDRYAAILG